MPSSGLGGAAAAFASNTVKVVSAFVQSDADGVILLIRSIDAADRNYGIREVGSGYSTTTMKLGAYANTMYLVGLDGVEQFDAWIENTNIHIYLVGWTKGSVVHYVDDKLVSDPTFNSWQQLDADNYAVDASANGLVFLLETTATRDIGLRHGDSTDDWNKKVGANTHIQGAVGINSGNQWDTFIEDTAVETFIAAYTKLVRLDIHADINAVIRQSDGTIRDTLATNVADSANINGTAWKTLTATHNFSKYIVVDQTDYLEIELFAEATINTSGVSASVDFRIDDPTLVLLDQASLFMGPSIGEAPSQTITLYVLDSTDGVYKYEEDGTFINVNALSPDNTASRGITTDDTDFWTTDSTDDEVYKYPSDFSSATSWALNAANGNSSGLTTDGTNIWIVDDKDDLAYKYDMSGGFVNSFALNALNADPKGITTDGINIWVVDNRDDEVYRYDMSGPFVDSFLLTAGNANAAGMTTDGNCFWVVDSTDDAVYKYNMSGIFDTSFLLDPGNDNGQGITVTPK